MAESSRSAWDPVREGDLLFMKKGSVWESLVRLANNLDREGIPFALAGGLALIAHGFERFTRDVDVLMTVDALEGFRQKLVGRGYRPAFSGARKSFVDAESGVRIEVLTTGEYPGDGQPKPVAFPDPASSSEMRDGLRVITLEKLIELKLASGMSAPHRRLRDLSDVQDLIATLHLPVEFSDRLDSSVAAEYRRIWQETTSGPPDPHEQRS
jgi:hypothetical protein